MGRGQIISGGEDGRYQVKLIYAYRSRVDAKIAKAQQDKTAVEARITALDALIAAETDQKKREAMILERSVLRLKSAALDKQIAYYQTNMPADPTVDAWCADVTEDLTGDVGTIEIPGEPSTVLIRPGYSARATYSGARDGQLMPAIAGSAHQVLFNWMLLPGWQRHKPIYRAGRIVPDSLDFEANTCSVCLDAAYSSQQNLPAVDGVVVGDCNMGDDDQSDYLTSRSEDFCSRNSGHPLCTQSPGSEITLSDGQLAQLQDVNYQVNMAHGRKTDASGLAVGDKWDVLGAGEAGDCEDFALTKMQMLVTTYGWNPNNLNIITAWTKDGAYHAMLGVRTKNRGLVVLDVNYNEVMESGRVPYQIDKVALASDTWVNYARRMDDVPIEYMTCNAGAFADEDHVVVEFADQKWTSPKVIGFVEEPHPCFAGYIAVAGNYNGELPNHVASWNDIGQTLKYEMDLSDLLTHPGLASSGLRGIRFAGVIGGTLADWNNTTIAIDARTSSHETRQDIGKNFYMLGDFQQDGRAFGCLGNNGSPLWASYNSDALNYQYSADSWQNSQDPSYTAYFPNAFTIDGTSYMIDGERWNGNVEAKKSYKFTNDSWSSINGGGMALCRHAAFSALGKGYCVLGYDDYGSGEAVDIDHYFQMPKIPENTKYSYYNYPLRQYDPLTDAWSNKTMSQYVIDRPYSEGYSRYPDGNDGQEGFGYLVGDLTPGDGSYLDIYAPAVDAWTNSSIEDIYLWNPKACTLSE